MRPILRTGTYRPGKLWAELLAAVPALAPTPLPDGRVQHVWTLAYDVTTQTLTLNVPDATPPAALDAVLAAHDPNTPSANEAAADALAAADTGYLANLATAYENMVAALDAMQADYDAIKARADTLAGLTTWSGLTLAQLTARLQQVMPPLGQDLSTLAVDTKTLSTGAERMLKALRVLLRRTGS